MGNVLRSLYGYCCKPTTTGDSDSLGPTALAHDLSNFEITFQVPEGLSRRVQSSKNDQANWYRELSEAWKEARPQPETPEEAASLVIQTLERHQQADVEDLEGLLAFYGLPYSDVLQRLLAFYGLPLPHTLIHLSDEIPTSLPAYLEFQSGPGGIPTSLPEGVQFVLHTLPVHAKAVGDGDGMTVYVSIADPRESKSIPRKVLLDALERLRARARKDYTIADELHQNIIDSGYRFIPIQKEEILARKYRIRLRGIDAPEMEMPYGNEAREELANLVQGKCLRVLVYEADRHGRLIGDVYCNGIFVQEALLKRGCAWYSKVHDKRQEFATWEKDARGKRVGLWADANPEKPWEWKKRNNPREG